MAFFKGVTIKNGATDLCGFVSVVSGSRCFCGGAGGATPLPDHATRAAGCWMLGRATPRLYLRSCT
jgi:hypothetical protein